MEAAISSLEEQVKTRVGSVENGRKFQNSGHGDATMPDGPSIFATTGAWEDFATPARDFRLLIAIDVVRGFPDRVARQPQRYAMPMGRSVADVKAELQSVLASELAARKFSYTRSDGSAWTLTLKDVIDRAADFEMAYNLNDCVELRWGCAGPERGGVDLQAACAGGAARQDDGVPRLVPRAALASARYLIKAAATGRAPSLRQSRPVSGPLRVWKLRIAMRVRGPRSPSGAPTSKPRRASSCCIS